MSSLPRLLYRGAADETAETKRVESAEELAHALEEGWRQHRAIEPPAELPDTAEGDEDQPRRPHRTKR